MQSELRTKGERLAGSTGEAAGSSPARPLQSLTMPIDEVAALLGRDVEGVKRRYRQLLATGFPRRLPGSDWCFSRALVRAWVNAQGTPVVGNDNGVVVTIAPEPVGSLVDLQHKHLSRKYGGERA